MKPPRVVFDVAVVVEAVLEPGSAPGQLLRDLIERREFELVLSPAILGQIERALADEEVRAELGADDRIDRFVAALGVVGVIVEPEVEAAQVGGNRDNDRYLAAALAAGGGLVVSRDPELLAVAGVPGVEVLAPERLFELLEAGRSSTVSERGRGNNPRPATF